MLTLQIEKDEVFIHYLPPDAGPNNGGYMGKCFPGGKFLGATYEELVALGTGKHEVVLEEKRWDNPGVRPKDVSQVQREAWEVFCYETGCITEMELRTNLDIIRGVKREGVKTFTLGVITAARLESWLLDIHINSFVRRQTAESPFSYWTCSDEELLRRIRKGWENKKPGYRDGVVLVPINPEGCFSGVVQLKSGDKLVGEYSPRKEGEDPRQHVYAVGKKSPAKYCYVVLYRHDVLAETKQNETDKEWEMVSFNASPTEDEPPIQPWTLIANHFQLSGGSATNMSDSEFVTALRVAVDYWKDKAMAAPKEKPNEGV